MTIRTHVPIHGLISANRRMQIAFMGGRIVGRAAAGAIAASFGPLTCCPLDALSFVMSAALIGSVVIRRPQCRRLPRLGAFRLDRSGQTAPADRRVEGEADGHNRRRVTFGSTAMTRHVAQFASANAPGSAFAVRSIFRLPVWGNSSNWSH